MNKEQLKKLKEYVKALIAVHAARNSSDGGLTETVSLYQVEEELDKLFSDDE